MTILDLPDDILFAFTRHFGICDVLALRLTCKTLYRIMECRSVWLDAAKSIVQSLPFSSSVQQALPSMPLEDLKRLVLRDNRVENAWTRGSDRRRLWRHPGQSDAGLIALLPGGEWMVEATAYKLRLRKIGESTSAITTEVCLPHSGLWISSCDIEYSVRGEPLIVIRFGRSSFDTIQIYHVETRPPSIILLLERVSAPFAEDLSVINPLMDPSPTPRVQNASPLWIHRWDNEVPCVVSPTLVGFGTTHFSPIVFRNWDCDADRSSPFVHIVDVSPNGDISHSAVSFPDECQLVPFGMGLRRSVSRDESVSNELRLRCASFSPSLRSPNGRYTRENFRSETLNFPGLGMASCCVFDEISGRVVLQGDDRGIEKDFLMVIDVQ
ncbi:hypothetical protein JAAARDRAFT_705691 [Jaapia argillacea MUCL 33604]|uniref:F-box domain-containing protein n=1 Tax=Jaapia argillacea MUCL 33604 TaxID=933084 RepID=A0A067Q4H9_9AGAM|nr:hypothetical protein JAAARDRAFT_705691 [Jaapia argillacea MUCL 33604]